MTMTLTRKEFKALSRKKVSKMLRRGYAVKVVGR